MPDSSLAGGLRALAQTPHKARSGAVPRPIS
eukprot:CAMPEP_0171065564 /NCGR_PEP_ID=MMETSP0766_2-20121228/6919_1 /TAXON_ID=439317 /ORGANISM="Gambierdiscus australes, Strain CAWD 149" /LENGTH=30 /DNA_ID= /DNA_START= /DNA_END= /DNA_ORIENTATION=